MPALGGTGQTLKWVTPSYNYLVRVLRNPLYAGAYAFGRRQVEEVLDDTQRPVKRMRQRDRSAWHVLIEDHHEGYITWQAFERNQRLIDANRNGEQKRGAPREGRSLLQGLILCGRCGRRMRLSYCGQRNLSRYTCLAGKMQTGTPVCQDFGGQRLEQRVEELVLEALEPLGVEAMIAASRAHAEANDSERTHWRQRVERARYEVDLARRQYDEVDPAHRLVARELERRFEKALESFQQTEAEATCRIAALQQPLDAAEQTRLRGYANDLRRLWQAATTRPQDRKRIIRSLIEHVTVTSPKTERTMTADVHWVGGEVIRIELERGRRGANRHVADAELIELIRTLARELSDAQIARVLNRRGIRTPKHLPFTANRVAVTRNNHGIEKGPVVPNNGPDIYSPHDAGKILGVSPTTVIRWAEEGLLRGAQVSPSAPWRVQVTDDDVRKLKAADAPEGWLSLKAAALALGISQQAVLQRLNSGRLQGVRVRIGRRSGWRIRVPAELCVEQPTLF
jgi:biotin operon repressor/tellurite resistance protein